MPETLIATRPPETPAASLAPSLSLIMSATILAAEAVTQSPRMVASPLRSANGTNSSGKDPDPGQRTRASKPAGMPDFKLTFSWR
ncbi:MAG: hypothetical protein VR70_04030 [Rhodospirillaceae bacterium BRH_c57]|nr:MAG: hypothetical protein VR70_04030 [Rhodospirillaceae bacterium BRH_c57]